MMNKILQIELWPECTCNRCKFCNLVLASELRGKGSRSNPNITLTGEEKNVFIDRAISFLPTVDWNLYDTLLLRGGEVFNGYSAIMVPGILKFLEEIANLIQAKKVKRVFLVTSLKYPMEGSLLKFTLAHLSMLGVNLETQILVGTSWDVNHRFIKESLANWHNNISILDRKKIPVHITSILTQALIEGFFSKNPDVMNVMSRDFDLIPAQGKPELLHLEKFFPLRKDCMQFLLAIKDSVYHPIWNRLLSQNARRAESIFFTEHNHMQVRDLKNYKSVLAYEPQAALSCGHPKEYNNYADSDACFLCDVSTVAGTY